MRPTNLRVWAPGVAQVDVEVDGRRRPMTSSEGGWWATDVGAGPGAMYGFCLDGGEALPDPRSAWQPDGVHGLSRLIDHAAFNWQAEGWRGRELLGQLVYELHIGTFTAAGTFEAAIERLDHLVDLGVDFVEILPVAAFPGRHGWGYDGVFPYAVQDSYGGPDGLKQFVDGCHNRGIGVILDVVYNHLGPDGNVLPAFGPYFTDVFSTPWGQAVNYCGAGSNEVRRYIIDNALMWLRDYRIDGLRLDAVQAILDTSATHVLEELAVEVSALSDEVGRPLALIAESDLNDPRLITARDAGGYGLDAQWSDDFHHALHTVVTRESFGYYEDFGSLSQLATALTHGYVYAGQYSPHRGRQHGRPLPASITGHRLLGYAQDHDQIGNRAAGDRLSALVSPELVKVAAALVLTAPFTPMLFMGEEWAASTPWLYFTDHEDPELAEAVRVGRRGEFKAFGWNHEDVPDPQHPTTIERSTLKWDELDAAPHADMLAWYRELIALRRSRLDLADGRFDQIEIDFDEEERWLVIRRPSTVVAVNLATRPRALEIQASSKLLASADVELLASSVTLPPESVAILAR
ncbi:MAG TPA: malto-oligosyltrehalose trehalohydrolase [Acidothermaceae bacterium]